MFVQWPNSFQYKTCYNQTSGNKKLVMYKYIRVKDLSLILNVILLGARLNNDMALNKENDTLN